MLLQRGGAKEDGSEESAVSSRTPARHTSPSADELGSRVLMLLDFFACGYESRVYSVFKEPPTRDSWEPARNNQRFL